MTRYLQTLACALLATVILAGCASGPNGSDVVNSGIVSTTGVNNLTTFSLTINPNGTIDRTGEGYYVFFINANGDPIDVTNLDTYTDVARFDGVNFSWFHRILGVPNNQFFLAFTSNVNDNGRVSGDQHSLQITFNDADSSSPFNQFIAGTRFTAQCGTTDSLNNAIVGQILDCLGQGPDVSSSTSFTVTADKLLGAISPLPVDFPTDPTGDTTLQNDLPSNFPYVNFDITSFDITHQNQ